ncbi:hypothetical protein Tco_0590984 [Tanacetum coccineum]
MKRGFRGAPRPLLPAMLLVATTNPSAGQEHHDVAQSQPSSSTIPVPSTSSPPVQSPPPIPAPIPTPTPTPISETDPEPLEHTFKEPSPAHQHFSPSQEHAQGQMIVDDLLRLVPQLVTRIDNLEMDLQQTKLTIGSAIVKLVKKVKKLEGILSPTTLEAAKTLSRVASQKPKSIDKGRSILDEDWDLIRAKIEANAELSKSVLGSDLQGEDFAKKMVELIARKGLHSDKTDEDEYEDSKDDDPISGTNIPINPVPVAIKPQSTLFNLSLMDIYMLIERKYPLSTEVCKAMLDKKLQEEPQIDGLQTVEMDGEASWH